MISAVFDFGMSLRDAIDAPRVHWDGECVQVEPGFDAAVIEELARRWPTNRWSVQDVYFGGAHAVSPRGEAAADPRRDGSARLIRP